MRFSDFNVGDYLSFERTFAKEDFENFAALSGDYNPLHVNDGYAANSGFKQKIVPLHISMAPFSMIAGMYFPGQPSLYLKNECDALGPVYYGQPITYSAKLEGIQAHDRLLKLSIIAYQNDDIKLKAKIYTKARCDEWKVEDSVYAINKKTSKTILITGAAGGIGLQLVDLCAQHGWNLVLLVKKDDSRLESIKSLCKALNLQLTVLEVNFLDDVNTIRDNLAKLKALSIDVVIHAASSPPNSSLEDLISTNYRALSILKDIVLSNMLKQQAGKFILLGSTNSYTMPKEYKDYSCVKSFTESLLYYIFKNYSEFGINSFVVAPHITDTQFSASMPEGTKKLSPLIVAEKIIDIIEGKLQSNYITIWQGSLEERMWGSHSYSGDLTAKDSNKAEENTDNSIDVDVKSKVDFVREKLDKIVRKTLNLPDNVSLENGGLGVTSGWNSLKHIQLILEVETEFGVKIPSHAMQKTSTFQQLNVLIQTYYQ
jgi:3-oxoacyl-[acyl-carrier protein] reductase